MCQETFGEAPHPCFLPLSPLEPLRGLHPAPLAGAPRGTLGLCPFGGCTRSSRYTPAGSLRAVHQHACAKLAARASAHVPACTRLAAGQCRASVLLATAAPPPGHRARIHGGSAGIRQLRGSRHSRPTNGISKTRVTDVLPADATVGLTVWWLMLARDPQVGGDQTDRRAQRSTVWGPIPERLGRGGSVRTNHGSKPAGEPRGPGATGSEGLWSRVSAVSSGSARSGEGTNLAARPGTVAKGVREEVSARRKDCLVPRRAEQGGPGSRFLACQLQAPLCGTETGGGREACSPTLREVGSWKPNAEEQKVDPNGGSGQRDSGSWFDP